MLNRLFKNRSSFHHTFAETKLAIDSQTRFHIHAQENGDNDDDDDEETFPGQDDVGGKEEELDDESGNPFK